MNGCECDRCNAYMQHMESEHHQLNSELTMLHAMLDKPKSRIGVVAELEKLRAKLASHFHEEEEGGCLEEAVCRCPSLAHEVSLIEAEHRDLLKQVDAMLARERANHATTTAEFEGFMHAIERHEAAEDHVLQHGLNVAVDV